MDTKRSLYRARWRAIWRILLLIVVAVAIVVAVTAACIAAVALLLSAAGPRIVQSSPADGRHDVPITAPVGITFSQAMDAAGVEARFRIDPEVRGSLRWDGKEVTFEPQSALAPGTSYTVTLEAGAVSQRGRPLRGSRTWRFRTREPQLLYLGRTQPGAQLRQLYVAPLDGTPEQLTDHPQGVWDYAVHPLGEAIVYSVLRQDGGADLWRMDRDGSDQRLLLACPQGACLNPAWSPDSGLLAYEQRDIWAGAPNLDPKAGRIWLLDLERGEQRPLFDYDVPLHSPAWAPNGGLLAYASPTIPGVEVYDLSTGELQQFANEWGTGPVWSPDGSRLVVPELMLAGEALVVRLVRVDLADEQATDISGDDDFVKDVSPAWSPGGGWIAFGREFLDDERRTPGRQIWLTRPDGREAYALPSEPMADRFAFAWRPDGGSLAYARTDLSEGPQPVPDVSIWLFDFGLGQSVHVADDGVLPTWLP